jgi:myxalamid-type nonribosomal peptide synthetase MxaA
VYIKQDIDRSLVEEDRYDLTMGQKALYFIDTLGGAAKSVYNESLVYSINGNLSLACLENTINSLIFKHAILRTSFRQDNLGNLFQYVEDNPELEVAVISEVEDLSDCIAQEIARPFDLSRAPLMRVTVIKKSSGENLLVMVFHHIIMDGISTAILMEDFSSYYNSFTKAASYAQDTTKLTEYKDYVQQEQQNSQSQQYQDKVNNMIEKLKGYSTLNFLPSPVTTPQNDPFVGDRCYFSFDPLLYAKVKDFAKANKSTVFHFLLATYSIMIGQYARTNDVVVGVPFANRMHDPMRSTLGYFANTLPIRILLEQTQSFVENLLAVRKTVFSYLDKQEVAFEHLASQLNLDRKSAGRHPIIQTLFTFSSQAAISQIALDGLEMRLEHQYFSKTSKFDLALFMLEDDKQRLTAYFEYRTSLFDRPMVEQFAKSLQILIKNILNYPNDHIASLRLLDQAEEQAMAAKFFTANADLLISQSLSALFSETVTKYPKSTALVFGDKCYSYQALDVQSNKWACYIRSKYAEIYGHDMPMGTLITLCLERHEDMIFAILGVLKAGGAYVPVDPRVPKERIDYIISDSQSSLLLTHRRHDALNIQFKSDCIIYMDDQGITDHPDFKDAPINIDINPASLAYVIYTSGSTGKPKGVLITHENVIALFESVKKQASFSNEDVWSLFHTYCFDVSVWEIWGALLFGAKLVMVPYEATVDPKKFYQLLAKEHVTILTQTPLAFQMVINEDSIYTQKLKQLRYVFFAGESLKLSTLKPWVAKYGTKSPSLVNMYGATEATIHTSYKLIEKEDIEAARDNVGKALYAFSLYIMDENLAWCPIGVVGEICIGGRGLAKGYLNREDLTNEKFIQDSYSGSRLYRTGDLGRLMPDGSIEYIGRKDFQVKLRGFRIELGEIEAALGRIKNIAQTLVLLKGEGDLAYLSAYYTVKSGEEVSKPSIITQLKAVLPGYMIPSNLTHLDNFPITVNGKIDRRVLYQLSDTNVVKTKHNPLRTTIEHKIASIWADVLKIDKVNIDLSANFFELGGNSLLVVKMLAMVRKEIGKNLPITQFMAEPVISTLTENETKEGNHKPTSLLLERLKKAATLPVNIVPLAKSNPNILAPQAILITGATGFLGAHLLTELLEKTAAKKIYCLIRATTKEAAIKYLEAKLAKYKLLNVSNNPRIVPILGQLNEDRLGLSDEDYDLLASEVDAIFHVGALVNHILDFNALYKTNIASTLELLHLATLVKNKAIHFVSTLAVSLFGTLQELRSNNNEGEFSLLDSSGYLTTKWVAEQLLLMASERGIAAHVYRPGNIIAGKQGVYEAESNHTLMRLKGMLQLGKAYVGQYETLEMMPVDLLAAAILKLAMKGAKFSYNLNNVKSITWVRYLSIARKNGHIFDWINDAKEWDELLDQLDENNTLYKLSWLYHSKLIESRSLHREIEADYQIETPAYEKMIEQQLNALSLMGFLQPTT